MSMSSDTLERELLDSGLDAVVGDQGRVKAIATQLAILEFECIADMVGMSASKFSAQVSAQILLTEQECLFLERLASAPPKQRMPPVAKRQKVIQPSPSVRQTHDAGVEGILAGVFKASENVYKVKDTLPRQALKNLAHELEDEHLRAGWLERARVNAIAGCCPKSLKGLASGLRCWFGFAQQVLQLHGKELPPTVDGLLQWSSLFRCKGTYKNYVNYVKVACELVGVSTAAFHNRVVTRAGMAIEKRRQFVPRPKMFIQLPLVERLVAVALQDGFAAEAMLYVACYAFLLRAPS
jgi:hypothetical protein